MAAIEPAPGKSCGSCTMCCKVYPVPVLAKPAGTTPRALAEALSAELAKIEGVTAVDVDLDSKVVTIHVTDADRAGLMDEIVAAVDEAGFAVA